MWRAAFPYPSCEAVFIFPDILNLKIHYMSKKPQQTKSLGNFNYGSLQSMMVFFSVPVSAVTPLLKNTGLKPGVFDGQALVNLNFERYAGFGSSYSSYVDEVEFNVVVFPEFRAGTEPELGVAAYLNGQDQSKTYGNYRINVPCDSPVAVKAGSENYGEVKFVAGFEFVVPDVNDPAVSTWSIRCFANNKVQQAISAKNLTAKTKQPHTPYIFDLQVNTNYPGFPSPSYSPFSPVPAYAILNKKNMITSSRVVFGLFKIWCTAVKDKNGKFGPVTPLPKGSVAMQVGDEDKDEQGMHKQLAAVFKGNPPAVGILLFESQPAASSGHTQLL